MSPKPASKPVPKSSKPPKPPSVPSFERSSSYTPPDQQEDPNEPILSFIEYPALAEFAEEFKADVYRLANLKAQIAPLKKEADELSDSIKARMFTASVSKVIVGDWKPRLQEGKSETVDPVILMQEGVSVAVIEKATLKSTWDSLYIDRAPKGSK